MLHARARIADRSDPEAIDWWREALPVAMLRRRGGGMDYLVGPYGRQIRISVDETVPPDRALHFEYRLGGRLTLERPLLTLRRFSTLMRSGSGPSPLFRPDPNSRRWGLLLATLDGIAAGASQRDMARSLFGQAIMMRDWDGPSDYLRARVRRLVRDARRLAAGAYLGMLRG